VPSSQTEQDYTATVASADDSDSTTVTVGSTVAPSLVSHWTFDTADTNSGTAVDVVGSNDGTIAGATTGVSGANQTYATNEAYSFDGSDDFVEASGVTVTGEFTFAAWVNTDVTDGSFRNIMGDTSSSGAKLLLADENWIQGQIQGSSGANGTVASSVINTNQWYHVAQVYDGSTLRLYLDGTEVDSTGSGPKPSGDRTFKIGGQTDFGHYWDGRIDDPRVYDEGLTSAEVSNLYNNGRI